jgi:sulfotransferase family protein
VDGNKTVGATGERSWLEWFSTRARAGAREAGEAADAISFQPSFFILGPPRTGTSWLHEILRGRAILPSSAKETRFFDSHFHRGTDWYRAHYPKTIDGRCIGEVAPTYFASAEARERIAKLFPQARVVCIFRNPVERVLSLYRVKRRLRHDSVELRTVSAFCRRSTTTCGSILSLIWTVWLISLASLVLC